MQILKKKTLTGWKTSVRNPDKQPYRKSGISDRHYKEKDNRFKLEKEKECDIVKTSLSVNILKEYITLMTSASDDIPKFMANKKDKRKRATFYFTLWRTY